MRFASLATLMLLAACSDGPDKRVEALATLEALSNGDPSAKFAGPRGVAVEKLRTERQNHNAPLSFDLREGDAPDPIGDGTCDLHAYAAIEAGAPPFIGLRLRLDGDGWHIAGYWTPSATQDAAD